MSPTGVKDDNPPRTWNFGSDRTRPASACAMRWCGHARSSIA